MYHVSYYYVVEKGVETSEKTSFENCQVVTHGVQLRMVLLSAQFFRIFEINFFASLLLYLT